MLSPISEKQDCMARKPHEIPFKNEKTSRLIPWVMGIMIYLLLLFLSGFFIFSEGDVIPLDPKLEPFILLIIAMVTFAALVIILMVFHTSVMVHSSVIDALLWIGAPPQYLRKIFQKQATFLIIKGTFIASFFMAVTFYGIHTLGIVNVFEGTFNVQTLSSILVFVPICLSLLTLLCGRILISAMIDEKML